MAKQTKKKKQAQRVVKMLPGQLWSFLYNKNWASIIIAIVAFLFYANTIRNGYTQDDAIVITDNVYTQQGVKGIPDLLKYDTFYGFFQKAGKDKLVSGGRYRPLTPIMFAIEHEITDKPWLGHLINVFLFAILGFVLHRILFDLLHKKSNRDYAPFIAFGAALLFVVHPIHTEAVANIKGRDEIMALLLSLLALEYTFKALTSKKMLWPILASLSLFLGLMAKENTITFVVVIPLTLYFFTKVNINQLVKSSLPLIGAMVLFLVIRGSILGWSLGEPSREMMNNPFLKVENGRYVDFTGEEKMATNIYSLGKYLQLMIVPHPLSHDYYPRALGVMHFSDWQVLLSTLLYLAMIVMAIRGFKSKKLWSYGILFYLLTISIVSNIVFPVGTHMSERFVFMPSVGFVLLIAGLVYHITYERKALKVGVLVLAGVALVFGVMTYQRNKVWKDNYTLFTTDVKHDSNSAKLLNAAGGILTDKAAKMTNEVEKNKLLNEAISYLQKAIKIHPNYKNAYLILGNAYFWKKDYEKAIQYYGNALTIDPDYEEATNNLGVAYREAGKYYGQEKGDLNKALQYLRKANEMMPDDVATLRLMGVAYGMSGQPQVALQYFQKVVDANPKDAFALFDLGVAYHNNGNAELGNQYILKAKAIDPEIETKRQQK